ncbi:unnamed protein product [Cylindrotheca closterium]|uniref:protein-serine/threonine phosphatase n=1 Tax=Cylindrotheca closterium TaxID=2856 RepID=A0AAD2FU36_9STRA|nr:unnamed protein product [Cylindrotheca closterium]
MGTYLSIPVTEKCEESGESLECPDVPCSWGVVDMQGWRKSMEDAHVAVTDIPIPQSSEDSECKSDAKIFGVFDGHGGAEVARFCSLYLVSVLTQQESWKQGVPVSDEQRSSDPSESTVGLALRNTFHSLDRMIQDSSRRDEIVTLRNSKPFPGERRGAVSIPADQTVGIIPKETNPSNKSSSESTDAGNAKGENEELAPTEGGNNTDTSDDDSTGRVGEEEAAELDRNLDGDEKRIEQDSNDTSDELDKKTATVTGMMQRILNLASSSGDKGVVPLNSEETNQSAGGPSAAKPTIVHNGRLICNLPDHPIHAGATAIVAVLTGRILTVANAGDSRAVLCRAGGKTEALSFDHKPQQQVESSRITKAGGFVNQFVPGIPPADQIITSEPDILQVVLHPEDEFIILGCDGIWDCLSNENAVQFVRDRINTRTPTEIGIEMLDEIISDDPRVTQGIGGDNMTIMIVDLRPSTRVGRRNPDSQLAANNETEQ